MVQVKIVDYSTISRKNYRSKESKELAMSTLSEMSTILIRKD